MIEKALIIYILLRKKLRNGKMKIVVAGSVKFTLIKEKKKAWKRKNSLGYSSSIFGITAVAYQYRFATNKYKLLFFYLFNRLFLAY